MKKTYWEVRKYNYKLDEVDTVFEGKKAQAIFMFKKLTQANTNPDIDYVLNKWVAERFWTGRGWAFDDGYELEDQFEYPEQLTL